MRRALVGCLALALGCGPLGSLLVLRRMSLLGDAMSHAVLPGVALGFLATGYSVFHMSLGGLLAGLAVATLAGIFTRFTRQREDANMAAFYLMALALGVVLVSLRGRPLDLMHFLFGSILAVNAASLVFLAATASLTLVCLALVYRPLLVECFDPLFLRGRGHAGGVFHLLFLALVVLNLVAGFQALGTLMAVGLMMLPAAAARFWAGSVWRMSLVAVGGAAASSYLGLLLSFYREWPSGPAIILTAGAFYLASAVLGTQGGLWNRFGPRRHLAG